MIQVMSDPLGLVGTTIDKYRVESAIAQGGFSVVYRATHTIWNQPVALKVFHITAGLPAAVRREFLDGFIQEGKLITSLSSTTAAIVQARDVGSFIAASGEELLYTVLEWLDGSPLDLILLAEAQGGLAPRSLPEILNLLDPVARALDTVHQLGVCHRDLKPGNLFVTGNPRGPQPFVKLLDFGIAKVMADRAQIALSETGVGITAFTPHYGAPEQFSRTHGATGPWSDVFSFALIIVELMRGGIPALCGDDYMQLAVASRDPHTRPTPRTLGLEVSDAVEATFARALAVSPVNRFRSLGEFWMALQHAVYSSVPPGQPPFMQPQLTRSPPPQTATTFAQDRAQTSVVAPAPAPQSSGTPVTTSPTPAKPRGVTLGIGILLATISGVAGTLLMVRLWNDAQSQPKGAPEPTKAAPTAPSASAVPPAASPPCPSTMAFIAGGKFFQGSDSADMTTSNPAHKVSLQPYCLDVHEVTSAQYKVCSDQGECKRAFTRPQFPKPEGISQALHDKQLDAYAEFCNFGVVGRERHPINCITWDLAANYCKFVGARLPTESEWEFAARGSDGRRFPWGDKMGLDNLHMNAAGSEFSKWEKSKGFVAGPRMYETDDGFPGTAPVGSFAAGITAFGLYDMVGNVFEWTSDWFAPYSGEERNDPQGPATGKRRVIRGGAFNGGYEDWVNPAFRYSVAPEVGSHGIGFRCAKTVTKND